MNTCKTVDNLRLPGEIRRFSVLCGDLLSGCEYSPTGQSLNLRDFPDFRGNQIIIHSFCGAEAPDTSDRGRDIWARQQYRPMIARFC